MGEPETEAFQWIPGTLIPNCDPLLCLSKSDRMLIASKLITERIAERLRTIQANALTRQAAHGVKRGANAGQSSRKRRRTPASAPSAAVEAAPPG